MALRNKEKYNEYMKAYMLKRYHEHKRKTIEYLGGKCVCCGSTENLQIDHKDPKLKELSLNKLWSRKGQMVQNEIEKCQLLCYACHLNKSKSERSLGNIYKEVVCNCGKTLTSIKQYAGHRVGCKK